MNGYTPVMGGRRRAANDMNDPRSVVVRMENTESNHNKEYHVFVIKTHGYHVAFTTWGRIGKTNQVKVVSISEAMDKLNEKSHKGYYSTDEALMDTDTAIQLIKAVAPKVTTLPAFQKLVVAKTTIVTNISDAEKKAVDML
jgi:predicted DNA-binding WGR domain protein